MAKQENHPSQNRLDPFFLGKNLTTERESQNGQDTMPTLQSADALERQTEDIHL